MEKKFRTLIREDHKLFGRNAYVRGRITGMQEIICDGERNGVDKPGVAPAWEIPGVGHVYTTICEPERYDKFANLVERHYPGLCVFNYREELTKAEES